MKIATQSAGPCLEALEARLLLSDLELNPITHLDPFADAYVQESELVMAPAVSFATSFDLRPSYVTPVQDQGDYGTCWTFATYGSLESSILKAGGPTEDFSENNLKDYHGFDFGPGDGGFWYMSEAYLSRGSGPIAEADDPYHAYDDRETPPPIYDSQYYVREMLRYYTAAEIKGALMSNGALYTTMYWYEENYRSSDSTYYGDVLGPKNHAITLVGWDDDKTTAAPTAGAWLLKNSWGTSFGDNGYFWASYADVNACKFAESFSSAAGPEVYGNVYYYDKFGDVSEVNVSTAFNAFTAEANEPLKAVGFFTPKDGVSYTIEIYDTFSGNTLSSLLATKSGSLATEGWHTVDLNSYVQLTVGDQFYVYLSLSSAGGWPMAIDYAADGYSSDSQASPGQSYYYKESTSVWTDLYSSNPMDFNHTANFCIKALTAPLGKITGTVWSDNNSDGVRQTAEPGLADWTVYLDLNNNGVLDDGSAVRTSAGTPMALPFYSETWSTINVSGVPGILKDVNVKLNITYPSVGYLAVELMRQGSPTRVTLCSAYSIDGANLVDTVFDEDAAQSISDGAAPYTGSWRTRDWQSTNDLSRFNGTDPNGAWTLIVSNCSYEYTGDLENWSLEFTTIAEPFKTTGAGGAYKFQRLMAGEYNVRVLPQENWLATAPQEISDHYTVTVGVEQFATGCDFGRFPTVFDDTESAISAYYVRLDEDEAVQIYLNPADNPPGLAAPPNFSIRRALLPSLGFRSYAYKILTVDFSGGSPVPAGGLNFEGSGWEVLEIKGTSGAELVEMTPGQDAFDPSGANVIITYSNIGSQNISLGDGDDTLTVDFSAGNPVPAAGITFDGGTGTGDTDTLKIIGTSGIDELSYTAGQAVLNPNGINAIITFTGVEKHQVDLDGGSDTVGIVGTSGNDTFTVANAESLNVSLGEGNDTLNLVGGVYTFATGDFSLGAGEDMLRVTDATVTLNDNVGASATDDSDTVETNGAAELTFNVSQHLKALELNGSSVVSLGGTHKVLVTDSLVIAEDEYEVPTARLDIGDGLLVINYEGDSPMQTIRDLIIAAFNSYQWDGNGIGSKTMAADPSSIYGIGYADNNQLPAPFGEDNPFGDTEDVATNAILVRYTLIGDVDLNGIVDDTDILFLTNNYLSLVPDWFGGDVFGYDGIVDDADVLFQANNYLSSV